MEESRADRPEPTLYEVFPFLEGYSSGPLDEPPRPNGRPRNVPFIAVASVLAALVIVSVVVGLNLTWTGPHQSALALAILKVRIIGGPIPVVVDLLALGSIVFLLARRPTRRRVLAVSIGFVGGAVVAAIILTVVSVTDALGVALSVTSSAWIVAGFAAIGLAVGSFWISRSWRIIGVAASIVLVVLAGTIGVNADFGLDPNVGALAGISTIRTITLPIATATPTPVPTLRAGGALWANWTPPRDMPSRGSISSVSVPGTISGFAARAAGLYLPPAALVAHPPRLPLVIMMMGQPGNPDPSFQNSVLDAFTARHDGLGPIVLVADQIGNPAVDPLCSDATKYGKAETYLTQDVVNWARSHLNVLQDPAHWTIAGYSNGGECAFQLGAKYPSIWGNVLDISGELYAGSDHAAATLASAFHGQASAYQATWPANLLKRGVYPDTVGIFTVGNNDSTYRAQAKQAYADATAAGWKATYFEVPNGGHVLGALNGGLTEGYTLLYPRLGLSDPSKSP